MATRTFELEDASRSETSAVPSAPAFARVDVYEQPEAILAAWGELETSVPCSIYQTRAFILPWTRTLGRKAGYEPRFVLARDRDGHPVAFLPLGLIKRGPFRVATWLGGKDANCNMPLLRRPSAWMKADVSRLLKEAARACGPDAPDIFELLNQPFSWAGTKNPFALLPREESPSAAYGTALPSEAETLFASKLSKETRKKLRRKEAKLASFGRVTHSICSGREDQTLVLDAFLAQKTARFRERGITSEFGAPEMRSFIEAASAPCGTSIELHALRVDERIIAVYGGGAHDGHWSGMFNSFDADEEIAKTSPGDLLLMRIMAACCTSGLAGFDLGIGQARYKAALCDEAIPMFDAVVAVGPGGYAYAALSRLRQRAKRVVKRSPRLLTIANRLRLVSNRLA